MASYFLATRRKWEKSFWLSSPAPSHENTTNCGGFSPGFIRSGLSRPGWVPVKAVEPSPIRRTALLGAGAAFLAPGAPWCALSSEPEQPASPAISAVTAAPTATRCVAAFIRPPSFV